ncbi:MAG: FIST C-terminal domain-containing protein [Archangium sp.]|nr:FIST C-terminal domain-containing protein [Archangium sp.]
MKALQASWTSTEGWRNLPTDSTVPDLVLVFGGRAELERPDLMAALGTHAPQDRIHGCSTGGEIEGAHVNDNSVVANFLWFDGSRVSFAFCELEPDEALGRKLASRLDHSDLVHVLVLSDGLKVNGSALVRGLRDGLPANVTVSGGLSGDGPAMKDTIVFHRGEVRRNGVAVIGFHGKLKVGVGSVGGWDSFGPARRITRAEGSTLYELDGEPALALYKRYLGEHAAGLPSSALLFPLLVTPREGEAPVVRTVLTVDEATGSMTFAGDVPAGSAAQLMRANFERIVEAGETAAATARIEASTPEFALLISCVGRKWILKQRVEDEVDAVRSILGEQAVTSGFYSYGELAPCVSGAPCQLHNQTMTVTTFSEH